MGKNFSNYEYQHGFLASGWESMKVTIERFLFVDAIHIETILFFADLHSYKTEKVKTRKLKKMSKVTNYTN